MDPRMGGRIRGAEARIHGGEAPFNGHVVVPAAMKYRERGRLHREAGEEGKREEGQKRREARDEATPSGLVW